MNYDREATLRDEKKIKAITEGIDLNKSKDVEKVFKILQSGNIRFETDIGRQFDDKIYDLYTKNKESIRKNDSPVRKTLSDKTKSQKENTSNLKKRTTKDSEYDEKINELVVKELKKQEKRRRFLIIIASTVALLSLGYFGIYNYYSTRTSNDYQQLSALKGSDVLSNMNKKANIFTVNKQEVVLPDILSDYETLYAKNSKLAGWLKIDGTNIDYPVMQTDNNDYYLNHNFNNEKDNNGCLFLDCECSVFPRSTNMIIYGHHMKSGNMFGYLQRYAKESYYQKHKTINFDTIYEKGTYEVMYVFYSKVYDNDDLVFKYYQFLNANSQKEFEYYMEEMSKLSLYDTGVTASYGDTLITLSTCDHSQTDGRFAVVAKRIN